MKRARVAWTGGVVILALLAAVGGTWFWASRSGSSALERWIGSRLIGVAQGYITPVLEWDSLDYQRPLTVVIEHPRLQSHGVTILSMDRLTLGLARIPRAGEPILIQRIEMSSPQFHFVVGADGALTGWNDFFRADAWSEPESVESAFRVSDVFQMRHFAIQGASFTLRQPDEPPMTVSDLSMSLETPPDEAGPGWYGIKALVQRLPLFEIRADGRFNIDSFRLELDPLSLTADLDEQRYEIFPPRIQQWLRSTAVRGRLELKSRGTIDIPNWAAATATAEVDLRDAAMTWRKRPLTIQKLHINSRVGDLSAAATWAGDLFDGQTNGSISTVLSESSALNIQAHASDCDLVAIMQVLAIADLAPGEINVLAGRLFADATAAMTDWSRPDFDVRARLTDAHARVHGHPFGFSMPAVRIINENNHLQASGTLNSGSGQAEAAMTTVLGSREPVEVTAQIRNLDAAEWAPVAWPNCPPEVKFRGNADGQVRLRIPARDWRAVEGHLGLGLAGIDFSTEKARIPLRSINIDATCQNSVLAINYGMGVFSGTATGRGQVRLAAGWPAELSWSLVNADFARLLREFGLRTEKYSGRLRSDGRLQFALERPRETLSGTGSIKVEEAVLMEVPLVDRLVRLVRPLFLLPKLPIIGAFTPSASDSAELRGGIHPDHVELDALDLRSALIAARGSGRVYYDGRVNLVLAAGPLEKIESMLGPLGNLIGQATDRVMTYEVTGTLSEPRFTPRPFGFALR